MKKFKIIQNSRHKLMLNSVKHTPIPHKQTEEQKKLPFAISSFNYQAKSTQQKILAENRFAINGHNGNPDNLILKRDGDSSNLRKRIKTVSRHKEEKNIKERSASFGNSRLFFAADDNMIILNDLIKQLEEKLKHKQIIFQNKSSFYLFKKQNFRYLVKYIVTISAAKSEDKKNEVNIANSKMDCIRQTLEKMSDFISSEKNKDISNHLQCKPAKVIFNHRSQDFHKLVTQKKSQLMQIYKKCDQMKVQMTRMGDQNIQLFKMIETNKKELKKQQIQKEELSQQTEELKQFERYLRTTVGQTRREQANIKKKDTKQQEDGEFIILGKDQNQLSANFKKNEADIFQYAMYLKTELSSEIGISEMINTQESIDYLSMIDQQTIKLNNLLLQNKQETINHKTDLIKNFMTHMFQRIKAKNDDAFKLSQLQTKTINQFIEFSKRWVGHWTMKQQYLCSLSNLFNILIKKIKDKLQVFLQFTSQQKVQSCQNSKIQLEQMLKKIEQNYQLAHSFS